MAILKNRPLFSACLLYIICAFCAYFSSPQIKIGVCCTGLALLLVCAGIALLRRIPKRVLLSLSAALACVILAFAISYLAFDLGMQTYEDIASRDSCTLRATVTERKGLDGMTVYRIRAHEIDGQAQHFDGQMVCTYTSYLQVGDQFTTTVAPSTYHQAESIYTDPAYALADGLRMQFTSEDQNTVTLIGENTYLPVIALHELNNALCYKLLDLCGEESGGLVCALLLGNKSFLPQTLSRDFSRAGASHMLALSGMHVSILIGAFGMLLGKLRVHRKARVAFLIVASVGYLLLTGVSISALRAVVMMCLLQLSYLLAADHDSLTALGFVGAGVLLFSPYSVCDTGFILSFLATFGIVVMVPPLHAYLKDRTQSLCNPPHLRTKQVLLSSAVAVLEALLIGVIACFSIMVPSCFLIGSMSVFSPLTTLLLSPAVAAFLVLGTGVLLCSPLVSLANIFATLTRLLYALSMPYVRQISSTDGALLPLTYDTVQWLSIVFCLAMLVLLVLPLRKKLLLCLPPALLCISLCIFYPINAALQDNTLRAAYTHPSSISEGLVSADDYRAYICDLSSGTGTSMHYAMHAAKQMHATEVGALLLTDYHTSQAASLTDLVSQYKTDLLYLPITTDEQDLYVQAQLCDIAKRYGVEVAFYQYGEEIAWYDDTLLCVHRTDISRSEQPILVITLERGQACLSMVGATAQHSTISAHAEEAIARADAIICHERGPKPRLTFDLSLAEHADVVFATRSLASYCDPDSLDGARSMTVCPEIVYFTLATVENP